jgi:3-isopropylmalate dehydratase small subunit
MRLERSISGAALVFGNEVNTDELHPSVFYSLDDARVRAGFLRYVAGHERTGAADLSGRIVLAGRTFGIGSSRETGARVFQLAGISAVVAVSFARIFERNLLNLGIPALTCPGLAGLLPLPDGTPVRLELGGDRAQLRIDDRVLPIQPLDPFWAGVVAAGGLLRFLGIEPGEEGRGT